ncbi:YybH family protein [Pseudomarimonas arenosa]|uniref:Nuclear transport factor 2 family protein n=1 Tax=Pseudomarimonas arenosa TaxID=2774145 RepID=A0AAW3ZT29_9GAMM|nr:nuclear transport factor 2 family protein [Pseudomarimonas arenosa]MBD8528207.1 nuclear transport factor 2 family protein [Pseudomarimonas arenosa]
MTTTDRMHIRLLCNAVLALALTLMLSALPAAAMSELECQVFERERAFAQSVADHDQGAFASFLHPNTVFNMADPKAIHGKQAVIEAWSKIVDGGPMSLRWHPQHVHVSGDGKLASSSGPFVIRLNQEDGSTRYRIGRFLSIWQRGEDGQWYVAMDGSASPPTDVDAAGAEAHMRIPAECQAESSTGTD